MLLLLLALQAAPAVQATPPQLPPAFVEQTAALADATVVSGFCLSLGWLPGPGSVTDAEVARLSAEHGVSQSDANILLLRQFADAGEALRARLPAAPTETPTQAMRLAFLDHVDAYSRRACAEVADAYPAFFAGDIPSNQARVDARIAAVRQQELARP